MKFNLDSHSIELIPHGKEFTVRVDGQTRPVEIVRRGDGWLDIRLPGTESAPETGFSAYVSSDGAKRWVTINGQTFQFNQSSQMARKAARGQSHSAGELLAPMPGQIRAVQVAEGETVAQGQTLLVLEAMKMEIKIAAPFAGKVKVLNAKTGQTVEKEQTLIEIEPLS